MSGFALISVPIAFLLAYVPHVAKVVVLTKSSAFDNKNPRDKESQVKGLSEEQSALVARLLGAHLNQIEMIGVYAGGVAACLSVSVRPSALTIITALYVGFRVAYIVAYALPQIGNGILRAATFAASTAAMLALWFTAAAKVFSK